MSGLIKLRFCPICGDRLRLTPLLKIRKHMNTNRKPNLNCDGRPPYPVCEASGKSYDIVNDRLLPEAERKQQP